MGPDSDRLDWGFSTGCRNDQPRAPTRVLAVQPACRCGPPDRWMGARRPTTRLHLAAGSPPAFTARCVLPDPRPAGARPNHPPASTRKVFPA